MSSSDQGPSNENTDEFSLSSENLNDIELEEDKAKNTTANSFQLLNAILNDESNENCWLISPNKSNTTNKNNDLEANSSNTGLNDIFSSLEMKEESNLQNSSKILTQSKGSSDDSRRRSQRLKEKGTKPLQECEINTEGAKGKYIKKPKSNKSFNVSKVADKMNDTSKQIFGSQGQSELSRSNIYESFEEIFNNVDLEKRENSCETSSTNDEFNMSEDTFNNWVFNYHVKGIKDTDQLNLMAKKFKADKYPAKNGNTNEIPKTSSQAKINENRTGNSIKEANQKNNSKHTTTSSKSSLYEIYKTTSSSASLTNHLNSIIEDEENGNNKPKRDCPKDLFQTSENEANKNFLEEIQSTDNRISSCSREVYILRTSEEFSDISKNSARRNKQYKNETFDDFAPPGESTRIVLQDESFPTTKRLNLQKKDRILSKNFVTEPSDMPISETTENTNEVDKKYKMDTILSNWPLSDSSYDSQLMESNNNSETECSADVKIVSNISHVSSIVNDQTKDRKNASDKTSQYSEQNSFKNPNNSVRRSNTQSTLRTSFERPPRISEKFSFITSETESSGNTEILINNEQSHLNSSNNTTTMLHSILDEEGSEVDEDSRSVDQRLLDKSKNSTSNKNSHSQAPRKVLIEKQTSNETDKKVQTKCNVKINFIKNELIRKHQEIRNNSQNTNTSLHSLSQQAVEDIEDIDPAGNHSGQLIKRNISSTIAKSFNAFEELNKSPKSMQSTKSVYRKQPLSPEVHILTYSDSTSSDATISERSLISPFKEKNTVNLGTNTSHVSKPGTSTSVLNFSNSRNYKVHDTKIIECSQSSSSNKSKDYQEPDIPVRQVGQQLKASTSPKSTKKKYRKRTEKTVVKKTSNQRKRPERSVKRTTYELSDLYEMSSSGSETDQDLKEVLRKQSTNLCVARGQLLLANQYGIVNKNKMFLHHWESRILSKQIRKKGGKRLMKILEKTASKKTTKYWTVDEARSNVQKSKFVFMKNIRIRMNRNNERKKRAEMKKKEEWTSDMETKYKSWNYKKAFEEFDDSTIVQ